MTAVERLIFAAIGVGAWGGLFGVALFLWTAGELHL